MAVQNARYRSTLFHLHLIMAIVGLILLGGFALFGQDQNSRKISQTNPAGSSAASRPDPSPSNAHLSGPSGAASPTAKASAATATASSPSTVKEDRLHSSAKSDSALRANDSSQKARLINAFGKFPLRFEANEGQTDGRVGFISRGQGYTLFLTGGEAVLSLRSQESESEIGSRVWSPQSKIQNRKSKIRESRTPAVVGTRLMGRMARRTYPEKIRWLASN